MTFRAGDVGNNVNGVNVASELGFVGTVNLNCAVTYNGPGTPAGAPTCKLSSNTVTFPLGSSLSEPSLTINTTARSNIRASGLFVNGGSERGNLQPEKVAFCALLLCFVPLRRREWRALMILIVLAAGFNALSGCSGGSSTNTPSIPIGTSAGSYTVTVTASSTAAGAPVPSPATIALTIN
jgi:hypothetical protein